MGGIVAFAALLGLSAFAVTSFFVGTRLLVLSLRTHRLPERLIGLSLFSAGGVGTALVVVSGIASGSRTTLQSAAAVAIHLGVAALGVFTWRVFRPTFAGATLVAASVALLVLSRLADAVSGHYFGVDRSNLSIAADYTGRIVLYAWATFESLRHYSLARRRVRVGLVEPLVANRFLLWAVGTGAALCIWLHAFLQELARRSDAAETYLVIAVLGTACAVSLWLAFFPPRRYRIHLGAA